MSLETYLGLTPYQFQTAFNAFIEKTKSDRQFSENTAWHVARWQVWRAMCPPKKKEISVMDMIELPGDEAYKRKKSGQKDPDRFKKLKEKWKA